MNACEAGIDTWRVLFETSGPRSEDESAWGHAGKGGRMAPGEGIDGHQVVYYPAHRRVALDGHPAGKGELGTETEVAECLERLVRGVEDRFAGVKIGSRPTISGLSRVDTTVTLAVDEPEMTSAALVGLGALDHPGMVPVTHGHPIYAVSLHAKRPDGHSPGILARGYDKSLEAGIGARGTLLRLEDQLRPKGERRVDPAKLDGTGMRTLFEKRFRTLHAAAKGVKVATLPNLIREVGELHKAGAITNSELTQISAGIVAHAAGVEGGSRATGYRRRALLRKHGLVLANEHFTECEVDMSEVLEAALEAEGWFGRG